MIEKLKRMQISALRRLQVARDAKRRADEKFELECEGVEVISRLIKNERGNLK